MTPFVAALSGSRLAARRRVSAAATSPMADASRNFRTDVFSDDFTALLRIRRFSFVGMRFLWT